MKDGLNLNLNFLITLEYLYKQGVKMGKKEALNKLDNLHSRIEFDIKRKQGKDQSALKDYKKMVEDIKSEIKDI